MHERRAHAALSHIIHCAHESGIYRHLVCFKNGSYCYGTIHSSCCVVRILNKIAKWSVIVDTMSAIYSYSATNVLADSTIAIQRNFGTQHTRMYGPCGTSVANIVTLALWLCVMWHLFFPYFICKFHIRTVSVGFVYIFFSADGSRILRNLNYLSLLLRFRQIQFPYTT